MKRRVVCAAIRAEDGDLLIGIRHYSPDMLNQIASRKDGQKFANRRGEDQGFVDQFGNYMDRSEALAVAQENNQIVRRCGGDDRQLFSENLY